MADNLPRGPQPPVRKKRPIFGDLTAEGQDNAVSGDQEIPVKAPGLGVTDEAEAGSKASTKPATRKRKGWDRKGQISVVLGAELHDRLRTVQKQNAVTYDSTADLVREAISEKLDRLE